MTDVLIDMELPEAGDAPCDLKQSANSDWTLEKQLKLLKNVDDSEDICVGTALELPEWLDVAKFRLGQKFFNDNYYALFVTKLCGLQAILTVPEISKILVMTKQSSEPKTAFKRYLSTITHVLLWYEGDILDNTSWAFKSLREVHKRHIVANSRAKKDRLGCVSQASLALTQFCFIAYGLLEPQKFGIKVNDEEQVAGFIHFWRTMGHLLGIQDRYNVCRDSVSETKALCNAILQEIFVPAIQNPHQQCIDLSTAMLQGMWAIVPQIDVEAYTMFVKYLSGIPVDKCSNWYSRLIFSSQKFVNETLLGSKLCGGLWRRFFNSLFWFIIVVTCKFPLLAYYAFRIPLKPLLLLRT